MPPSNYIVRDSGEGPKPQNVPQVQTTLEVIFVLLTALLVLFALASSPIYACCVKKLKNTKKQEDTEMNELDSASPDARGNRVFTLDPRENIVPKLMSGATFQGDHQASNPYDHGRFSSRRSSRDIGEQVNITGNGNFEMFGKSLTDQRQCIENTTAFDVALTLALNAHSNTWKFQNDMVRIGAEFHPYGRNVEAR